MKVFLIDNNKIIKYMLPSRVDDSFLITYSTSTIKECQITFKGIRDSWFIKSNGTVNIIENDTIIDEVKIAPYQKYNLKIVGKDNLIEIYFLPEKEGLFKLKFSKLDNFSVGSQDTCHLSYPSKNLAGVEAMFKLIGNDWVISTVNDDAYKVYINNQRITLKKLKAGDIIFIGGLKIIWMNPYIYVNNPQNSLKVTSMELIKDKEDINTSINPVSEEEKSVDLYKKDDYFVHYPKIGENVLEVEVNIDTPPGSEIQQNTPQLLSMGSSIVMFASSAIMLYNVFYGLYNGRALLAVLPQLVMFIAMLVGSLIFPKIIKHYQKKQALKKEQLRQEKYSQYLVSKDRELQLLVKNQLQILNNTYLSTENCLLALEKQNKNFWWCSYNDKEFLNIRLGVGKVKPAFIINAPEEHFSLYVDNLLAEVYKLKNKYQTIDGAPITLSLKDSKVTSLILNNKNRDNFVNSLLAQILILQSSIDLKVIMFTNEEHDERWNFMKYIPHSFSADFETRFYATNETDAKVISNFLEEEIKKKKETVINTNDNQSINNVPYYLIITDDYKKYKNITIIDNIVNKGYTKYGISLFDIEDSIKNVPINSESFIEVNDKDGVIIERNAGLNSQILFFREKEIEIDMQSIAKKLANIPVEETTGPTVLPSSLSFLDMFGVSKIEQLNILNRWQMNNPVVSLDTVIGIHASGEKFKLDLHEKFHGPHGLIAGSTGSGKSEFIITYILSMIINYHPYEVQFVLIDYKGGGLAGAFQNRETGVKIPHLIGTITNLDASEMNRSLVSINSELKRRQKIFNEVRDSLGEGTIDIYKYQKLYREGIVKKPMAHLFIICDEFAELKQQRPEFMQQLISASRIGRSLGIHLILATQKPSGVVNDQIWANSKFKVCLKVQDRSDSMEMLKRPEAASIKEAGRFYLQVGYNDLFDIGQSGWSGAKYVPSDRILRKTDESLTFINNVGYVTKSVKVSLEDADTKVDYGDQLTNIVKYIYNLGKRENLVTDQLWLNPIPAVINIKDLKEKYNYKAESYDISPIIGEYDDPVNITQGLYTIDLTRNGNTLIYGVSGSGKEKLLTTMIRSIITDHTPEEVNIYIIDCGSESLKIFAAMPHIGDVITVDEPDKMYDLFDMASKELERRKDLFAEYAGSYTDYITNSGKKLPLITIIINGYDLFQENFGKLADAIAPLFRDGHKYGVVFVISAIATNAIRSRLMQYFNNRICLQLPNDTDYHEITGSMKGITPAKYFGRGIATFNDHGYEFQTASFAPDKDVTNSLRQLASILQGAYTHMAPPIPTIPLKVESSALLEKIDGINLPVGYNYNTKEISYFNFNVNTILPIVASDINDIKISFVHTMIKFLSLNSNNNVTVIDYANAYPNPLTNVKLYNKKETYEEAFISMYNSFKEKGEKENFYFVIGPSYIKQSINKELYKLISNLWTDIKDYSKSHVIFVDVTNGIRSLMLEDWYSSAVSNKTGIWLGENFANQVLLNTSTLSSDEKRLSFPYMAVTVVNGKATIIKHIIDMEDEDEE